MTDVVVVGSLNMDLVVRAPRMPRAGETLTGNAFATYPGGKGANQAVAAARLGADVAMVGRVGDDPFGSQLLEGLRAEGIATGSVQRDGGAPTGVAAILVEEGGENRIVIVAGANGELTPEDVERSAADGAWDGAKVLLLQLEVPFATVAAAARLARRRGMTVLFDPAPAPVPLPVSGRQAGAASGSPTLPDEILETLSLADAVLPNQTEAQALTGIPVESVDDARRAARALRAMGPAVAVVKLGGGGVFVDGGGEAWHVPGVRVQVVDTTAAGDAFAGALAARLARGDGWREAVAWANRAAALSVTRQGAQPAMPRAAELAGLE